MAPPKYVWHDLLPANAPVDQAHLLESSSKPAFDIGELSPRGRKLWDFLVTFLNDLKHQGWPCALKDFFDPEITNFRVFWPLAKNNLYFRSFVVWHRGKCVMVSPSAYKVGARGPNSVF